MSAQEHVENLVAVEADRARVDRICDRLIDSNLMEATATLAQQHFVSTEEMLGRRRTKSVKNARKAWWKWLRWDCGKSTTEIGEICEVDHSTVCVATRRDT